MMEERKEGRKQGWEKKRRQEVEMQAGRKEERKDGRQKRRNRKGGNRMDGEMEAERF